MHGAVRRASHENVLYVIVSVRSLAAAVYHLAPRFAGFEQQDAQVAPAPPSLGGWPPPPPAQPKSVGFGLRKVWGGGGGDFSSFGGYSISRCF
eukprot:SAG11_NODE_7271_length_1168_cov_0.962582_1_plen_93_part_00